MDNVAVLAAGGLVAAGLCSVSAAMVVAAKVSSGAPPPPPAPLWAPPVLQREPEPKPLRAAPRVSKNTPSPRAAAAASSAWDAEARMMLLDQLQGGEYEAVQSMYQGFSMEEALSHSKQSAQLAKVRTPEQVLAGLQKGNTRFWMGVAKRPELSAFERRALIANQYPSVAILGCSDSRVPIEIVFDQGLGDIFVIRVAGNCLDQTTMGSLEYAAVHLGVKVLIVMGHEGCGAVKASRLPVETIDRESASLSRLLKGIKAGLNEDRLRQIRDQRACDREAVVSNVKVQVKTLCDNEVVRNAMQSKTMLVKGAFYDMSSGIVDFFDPDPDVCGQVIAPAKRSN